MRKALATFGVGPHAAFVPLVLPGFARYAARHDYCLVIPSESAVRRTARYEGGPGADGRPPSWWKVPLLLDLLGQYDRVLWLDADVCVVDPSAPDVFGSLRDGDSQGLVFHEADVGTVPNCGVWAVTDGMHKTLAGLWDNGSRYATHGWWEQAALMAEMGMDPEAHPVGVPGTPNPLLSKTAVLPPSFNWHVGDAKRVASPFFAHATMLRDREDTLRRWAAEGFFAPAV